MTKYVCFDEKSFFPGRKVFLLFVELSKMFQTVRRKIQIQKLEKYGIFRKIFYSLKVAFQTESNILSIEIVLTNRKRLKKNLEYRKVSYVDRSVTMLENELSKNLSFILKAKKYLNRKIMVSAYKSSMEHIRGAATSTARFNQHLRKSKLYKLLQMTVLAEYKNNMFFELLPGSKC